MDFLHFYTWICLCLAIIIGKLSQTVAKPTFDGYIVPTGSGAVERFDYDYYQPYTEPLTESRLRRLRRGYYYVDDGYITAVPESSIPTANRRQDVNAGAGAGAGASPSQGSNVQFTPLVRYKHTRTKRKKLFVPNLFG